MMSERFTEVYPNIIESNYHFKDNGKGITHKEVVDLLNKQDDCISRVGQKIDDYLLEMKYQLEQGTELKDTYVRYGRFKQILLELKGELEL